ncbi:MAG: hypothetical protein V5A88_05380 [Candidatus Thermoplasmatota archaeon]
MKQTHYQPQIRACSESGICTVSMGFSAAKFNYSFPPMVIRKGT